MELTDEQKVKLVNAVGWDQILLKLPHREFIHALDLFSYKDVENEVGCSRGWLSHQMRIDHIPEPSVKLLKRFYFTREEVSMIKNIFSNTHSKKNQKR